MVISLTFRLNTKFPSLLSETKTEYKHTVRRPCFIMREVWLLVFKCPSQAQVDNEYSKDDIMLKGIVIRENKTTPPLP